MILTLAALVAAASSWLSSQAAAADKPAAASSAARSGQSENDELEKLAEAKAKILARPTPEWMPKPVIDIPDSKAENAAGMKPYVEQIPGTEMNFKMVPIPGGKFRMGSPASEKGHAADEAPQHDVSIEPFWMEEHEVTWTEYELWGLSLDKQRRKVLKAQSTARDEVVDAVAVPTNPYQEMSFGMGKDNGKPAICMTQFAAKVYCRWLSAKTGRYYRLPTEAEWEYACRAGTTTAYSFGNDASKLGEYAWFSDNSDDHYHKVATKKPNAWGLYDMHGNVSEWCIDQYAVDFYGKNGGTAGEGPAFAEHQGIWPGGPRRLVGRRRRQMPFGHATGLRKGLEEARPADPAEHLVSDRRYFCRLSRDSPAQGADVRRSEEVRGRRRPIDSL